MSIRIGKWFWISSIILILTISATYIVSNFVGIGPVPVRSAFAGRLPSTLEGSQRRFEFFYTTNREDSPDTFDARGSLLGKELLQGTYDVLITPGMPIEPFVWFDAKHMQWAGRQALLQGSFHQKLKDAVQASPQKSLLVVVWGFRDWFQSAALKTAYSAYALDINTPVLLFDWPGNQGEGRRGYHAAQSMATKSGADLGRMLLEVAKQTGADNMWVIGSSLGCQTICDAFVWLADQPDTASESQLISHVVLSAPDVGVDAFDDTFSSRLQRLSKHLTSYVSSNDRALLMSHWINGQRRLGRKASVMLPPEERQGEYEFEEAEELLDLRKKGAQNIAVVDATPINVTRNLHHFFTDSPVFFDDLYQRLLRPDDIVSRPLHTTRAGPDAADYSILWND